MTGSQGEPMAALSRIARGEHQHVQVKSTDKIIFSASPIPGNTISVVNTIDKLMKLGCTIVADKKIKKINSNKIKLAKEKDWYTEYLSPVISIKTVNGVNEAISHINKYGTSHTDSIVTNNRKVAKKFLNNVNSSIVMHNTSTQFADGGEFGFGAEVGISTNKLHPRGPVGLDQLTTYKYILVGKGQIRS